jgi:ubiquinone/menaquinone biosynthesis C-methylase UbiE
VAFNERLFALYYPPLTALAERAGMREKRRELIARARGRTVEVGAGSGLNLPHYTGAVDELILTEPSEHMLARLREQLAGDAPPVGTWKVVEAGAEALPFEDASVDTVVCTYVLCTVPDQPAALREIARVLRPGGRLLFLEHVHAGGGTKLGRFQDLVERAHVYIAAGCHPNRHTADGLAGSPLEIETLERGTQPRAPLTVRPIISGSAVRP